MSKEELKKSRPSENGGQKSTLKSMIEKGIKSQADAKACFDALGVVPRKEYNGKMVEHMFMTVDGMPFYTQSDAFNHARKASLGSKDVFVIKID